jgi:hypothetical protein
VRRNDRLHHYDTARCSPGIDRLALRRWRMRATLHGCSRLGGRCTSARPSCSCALAPPLPLPENTAAIQPARRLIPVCYPTAV